MTVAFDDLLSFFLFGLATGVTVILFLIAMGLMDRNGRWR